MVRYYYENNIKRFCADDAEKILGILASRNQFELLGTQRDAWICQIELLQRILPNFDGKIYFEFSIPRMGKRIDTLLLISGVIFILEFKVGSDVILRSDYDQVMDYALDMKNFHEGSHDKFIAPILVSTRLANRDLKLNIKKYEIFDPLCCGSDQLEEVIKQVLAASGAIDFDHGAWEKSGYKPTPTIIEATLALYAGHSVTDISRRDADASNLSVTSKTVSDLIKESRSNSKKTIIFVTGVPGAGKTLVGLNIATSHISKDDDLYSVFLSGNGPLVSILQEALARDKVSRNKNEGRSIRIGNARSEVKAFIQNVHHFRDDGLANPTKAPVEHVAIFDEAQRAWNKDQTVDFMRNKKGISGFKMSEPEFLISCMDRHTDWAVIICLVGGGQEINKGEVGIIGWVKAINESFPQWNIYASDQIFDSEYGGKETIDYLKSISGTSFFGDLHLKSSIRSFRSEKVSLFVKQLLDIEMIAASKTYGEFCEKYPIALTRDINVARDWLRSHALGSERYGIVVSSQAERLRPLGVHVKAPVNPVDWFLGDKDHVKSSYYLEDVATEFHVQGLELDWACLVWDADFRYDPSGWKNWSFKGSKWQQINKLERKQYQKNSYRVLLTRARQGMIVVVPEGNDADHTRPRHYYDATYKYLKDIGLNIV